VDTDTHPQAATGPHTDTRPEDGAAQSLAQLLGGTHDLFTETLDHVRGIGDLAFMELELAMSTFQWWLGVLVLFVVCSIMAGTFVIAATVIVFTGTTFSPSATILLMGGLSAAAACVLFFCLKSLAKKMTFRTLREHLTRPQDNEHVETRS